MAETRRFALNAQLDIEQILQEAQHRWLRPAEICEILRNYQKFQIAPEPPNRPPNGSLFLFDRKVLRYFRKDGHNWRKKKDGKTVKEAHERLKAGSIDVLHCYYAHGEENENFQRRSYWMLEEELSHIVLVHYREVKGSRTNYNRVREAEQAAPDNQENEDVANSEVDSSLSSKMYSHDFQVNSQATDTASLNSAQASEYEDAESAYNNQTHSGFHSFPEPELPVMQNAEDGFAAHYPVSSLNNYQGQFSATFNVNTSTSQGVRDSLASLSGRNLNFPSWDNVLENRTSAYPSVHLQTSISNMPSSGMSRMDGQGNAMLNQVMSDGLGKRQEFGNNGGRLKEWQTSGTDSSHVSKWSMDQKLQMDSAYNLSTRLSEANNVKLSSSLELFSTPTEQITRPLQDDLRVHFANAESGTSLKTEFDNNLVAQGKADCPSLKLPHLDGVREGLKKLDSFDRWMSKELGDVDESHIQSSSGTYWEAVGNENGVDDSNIGPQVQLDPYLLDPSLSQDQYFSIIDFCPNWAHAGSKIKVLITGRFLKSQQEVEKCKWACMFGEVEVPAEVIENGVLRCYTPIHKAGRVPFYVTCSNRLACSEVREFEFHVDSSQEGDVADASVGPPSESVLLGRFTKLLSLGSRNSPISGPSSVGDTSQLCSKISSLLSVDDSEWEQMLNPTSGEKFSIAEIKDQLLQILLKEKLNDWLLEKIAEGGKGPNVLDGGGQGVLHLAAALGYHWAIPPTIVADVSINFRDINGWTALHWAALYGRERIVGFLISRGAAAGALTDPTPKHPSGRTPADLASSNGHKGIAGYLAECALSSHLSSLKLKEMKEGDNGSGVDAVLTITERTATPVSDGDLPLKDSLAAVRNATQAAARIHQVFRVESFQRKQLKEYGKGEFGLSDERALSLLAVKTNRGGQHDEPVHSAAIRIQNKFRSWKGRKEFLQIRQRVIKIQAHFRGHQVRKNYKKIIWSVGIVEKIILRWRRKGSGLRGFKPDGSSMQGKSSKEDDYDFLKEGRKQKEEILQKTLARVKSMVQYPEARDQYRRLLNVVSEMQENKTVYDKVLNTSEEAADFDDDLIDVQALLDDDIFMSL